MFSKSLCGNKIKESTFFIVRISLKKHLTLSSFSLFPIVILIPVLIATTTLFYNCHYNNFVVVTIAITASLYHYNCIANKGLKGSVSPSNFFFSDFFWILHLCHWPPDIHIFSENDIDPLQNKLIILSIWCISSQNSWFLMNSWFLIPWVFQKLTPWWMCGTTYIAWVLFDEEIQPRPRHIYHRWRRRVASIVFE